MTAFGMSAGYFKALETDGMTLPWQYALRWYVATGHLAPPAEASLATFLNFTRLVAGHKQLRKAILALAESEPERDMFDSAMRAAAATEK